MNNRTAIEILREMDACEIALEWASLFPDDLDCEAVIDVLPAYPGQEWLLWIIEHDAWGADSVSSERTAFQTATEYERSYFFENVNWRGYAFSDVSWMTNGNCLYELQKKRYEDRAVSYWNRYRSVLKVAAIAVLEDRLEQEINSLKEKANNAALDNP